MSSAVTIEKLQSELTALEHEYQGKREAILAKVQLRLDEIAEARAALDQEEAAVRQVLNGDKPSGKRTRRIGGPRITAVQKRNLIAQLIREGHIRSGGELSKGLRAVLTDGGFKAPDFVALQSYSPEGWLVEKNGERGVLARTVFRKGS
jgi:hypothetical protein